MALYLLILEATGRAGGVILFAVVLMFSLYSTFVGSAPDPLSGFTQPSTDVGPFFMISAEASFRIPMQAFGTLVIGFILFGSVLRFTGGGYFFNDLAMALAGHYRGGAGKVLIFASDFIGSMSGSVISNVLTTGAASIPAIKASGFSARFAAATEACASTGGVLIADHGGDRLCHGLVAGASLCQDHARGGEPLGALLLRAFRADRRLFRPTRADWPGADGSASRRTDPARPLNLPADFPDDGIQVGNHGAILFRCAAACDHPVQASRRVYPGRVRRHDRVGWPDPCRNRVDPVGDRDDRGAFQATGLTGPLANELVHAAGNSTAMLLFMGALTSFIFGMGMTATACYIFMAVILAPALV